MFIRRFYHFGLCLLLGLISAGPVWAVNASSSETLAWVDLIKAIENQPMAATTLQAADQFLDRFPQSSRKNLAQFMKAEILFSQGEYPLALTQFQAIPLAEVQAFGDTLLYRLGECAFNQENYQAAEAYWDQLFMQFPDSVLRADVLAMQGRLFLEEKKYTEAAAAFRDLASRYAYGQARSAYGVGMARLEAAQQNAQAGLERLKPWHTGEALYWKSKFSAELRQYPAGADLVNDALKSQQALVQIAVAGFWIKEFLENNQWALALPAVEKLMNGLTNDPTLRDDLAVVKAHCLFNLQRYPEVIPAYTAWLSSSPDPLDPNLPAVYQHMAQTYYKLGKDADAMAAYKKYLQALPAGAQAKNSAAPEAIPLRFERARLAAEKLLRASHNLRATSPWLTVITQVPILSIQPQKTRLAVKSWTLTVADDRHNILHQQNGGAAFPDQLTWDGQCLDGRYVLAGDVISYTITLVGQNGKPFSTTSAPRSFPAVAYLQPRTYTVSILSDVLFEKETNERLTSLGNSMLTEASDLCLRHLGQGLRLQISAPDPALGQRQAKVLLDRLQEKLELPSSWITLDVLPSQAPAKERVLLQCLQN